VGEAGPVSQPAATSTVLAVGTAAPPHRYPQEEITEALVGFLPADRTGATMLRRFHVAAGVRTRNLAMPLEEYADLTGFSQANDTFIAVSQDLGEQAVLEALARAGLAARDVDILVTTTVTGVAAPSLDARLVGRLGLRPDVKRVPLFGLGCVAGAAGIARLHDYLAGHPDEVAVLLAVELCSLTVQRDDSSTPNLVASGLFGDGAAAVVMAGERRARAMGASGPAVLASRSRLYPDTERVMGWDIGGSGFRIVLAASVADVVEQHLGVDVKAFLADHDLEIDDVRHWVSHPGGPKVLDAVRNTLSLPDDALALSWRSLADVGNLSSASVLHVLAATMDERPPRGDDVAVLMAMGPGFCSELVLLRW
jgi:alkylresorcinol/alkylpyrone synthase